MITETIENASNGAQTRKPQRPYSPASDIIVPRHLPQAVGLSSTTVWRLRRAGEFPRPIRLSVGRIGWRRADLEAWLSAREAVGL